MSQVPVNQTSSNPTTATTQPNSPQSAGHATPGIIAAPGIIVMPGDQPVVYMKRTNVWWMSAAFAVGGAIAGALGMAYVGSRNDAGNDAGSS